jgi:hypothetical protein
MNLTVLGLGADPRFFRDAEVCVQQNPAVEEPLPLTYREQAPEQDPLLYAFELLFNGDLIDMLVDVGEWLRK